MLTRKSVSAILIFGEGRLTLFAASDQAAWITPMLSSTTDMICILEYLLP